MIDLSEVRRRMREHQPEELPMPAERRQQAAVALILAGDEADLHLCYIRRASHPNDPWSGQMAFPGGRADEVDSSLLGAAQRETLEEVGLDLATAEQLGGLSQVPISRRGVVMAGIIAPFVFHAGPTLLPLRPNEEVAAAHWIPLRHLGDPGNRTELSLPHGRYPGIRWVDGVIWGLTYRMTGSLFRVLGISDVP